MRYPLFFYVLISVGLVTACSDKAPIEAKAPPKVDVVQIGDATKSDGRLFFPAVAHAADRSSLSFRVNGEVSRLNVRDGDNVVKGQVIAELDPTDYKLDVDNASASYSVANSQYKRSEQLVKKGLLAQSQFDELAAQRMIAKSELDLAKLRLSFTQLKAPIDGIISRVNVEQFENVQAGQQIINIHNPKSVDIFIVVPDKLFVDSPSNFDYQTIQADVRLSNGKQYRASLKEYTTEQDDESGTYTVTMTMPVPDGETILDGMPVDVAKVDNRIGKLSTPIISLPIEAIFNPDGESLDRSNKFVWVLNSDSTVTKTKVITKKVNYGQIQVIDGLSQGDKVVIAGIARLRDGIKVDLIEAASEGKE